MQNEGVKGNAFDLGDIPKFRRVTGARKAAILLMTLGAEVASSVIKNLSDRKIQKIGVEIANTNTVRPRERREVLQEFIELNKGKEFVIEGGIDCAKSLLNGALGSQRATKLLEGIKYDAYTKLFISARKAEPEQILSCIQGESPQAIAILLSHIQPDKAAVVLSELSDELKLEISLKIGMTSNVPPAVIKAIDKAMEQKLNSLGKLDMESYGGVNNLVDILSNVDRKTEKSIIKFIEEKNEELAEEIKSNMFIFDDIVRLDNMAIQRILKEVNVKDLAFALKGASADVSNVIFRNQSQRASQALREEIDLLGKVKISQVEEAQQSVVNVVRRLEDAGEITLSRGSEDEFI